MTAAVAPLPVTDTATDTVTRAPSTNAWAALRAQLVDQGCFVADGRVAVLSLAAHVAIWIGCWLGAARMGLPYGIGLGIIGSFMFYRIGWLMHDAAHNNACADRRRNELFANACCAVLGEFLSGWRYGHSRHHAAPNVRGKDSDQSERWDDRYRYRSVVLACCDLFLLHRFGRFVRVPKTLFLLGIRDGVYCFKTNRGAFGRELALVVSSQLGQLAFFCALFGGWGVVLYVLHSHIGIVYLNAVFSGNHYDLESFTPETAAGLTPWALQVRTSRNYGTDVVTRFVCGGLEYQVEHHLFPTMPRRQLRVAAPIVEQWCAGQGLPYHRQGLLTSLAGVVRFHLVAR